MCYPSKEEFIRLAKRGNLIPVYKEICADLETPVSAFLKISKSSDYGYLLESVEGQEKIARFSFIACNPSLIVAVKNKKLEILHKKNNDGYEVSKSVDLGNPLVEIKKLMSGYKFVNIKGLPRFCGGLVGYIGYDITRFFENIPNKNPHEGNIPDAMLMLTDTLLVFDHAAHKLKIVACAYLKDKSKKNVLSVYNESLEKIYKIIAELKQPLKLSSRILKSTGKIEYKMSKKDFAGMIAKAKSNIRKGDVIQVVLSQVLSSKTSIDSFSIYRNLRALNPSAYMFYLKCKGLQLVGSSPEMLVRCENGVVTTRPIAGTRPRGKTENDDARLEKELLADKKENAEHIMLVDLGRNDLGRVCDFGSVKVSEFMRIEKYSHVMHIVSEVRGKLKKGKDIYDVLQAAFPAGTVTGSPKVRAMEIIDELENSRRGPYAGAVGYFSFSGNLDTCITIRTIVVNKGTAYIQAGAGIVADSVPAKEYKETLNKAKAQLEAIKGGVKCQ